MKERLFAITGLALYWPSLTGSKVNIHSYASSTWEANVLSLVYFSAIVVFAVITCMFSKQFASRILAHRYALLAVGIGASAALLPGAILPSSQLLSLMCIAPSTFLSAASFCLLGVAWGAVCLSPGYERARATFTADVAVSFLLGYSLPIAFGLFNAEPQIVPQVIRALCPALSSTLLFAFPAGVCENTMAVAQRGKSAPPILYAIVLFVLLASLLVGIHGNLSQEIEGDFDSQKRLVLLLFSALLVPLMYFANKYPRLRLIAWGTGLLLVFSGALIAIVLRDSFVVVGYNALIAGRLVVWVMLWMLLVEVAKREHRDVAFLMGLFFLAPRGISCAMADTIKFFIPTDMLSVPGIDVVMFVIELALVACAFAFIGLAASSPYASTHGIAAGELPGEFAEATRHSICRVLSEENGLTEREATVLEYLSMGYTTQRIAETQYVSQNTIRTHVKGIYRKLGCHSKQDVIELVNQRMGPIVAQAGKVQTTEIPQLWV